MRALFLALPAALVIAACAAETPDGGESAEQPVVSPAAQGDTTAVAAAAEAAAGGIPQALQGRWGMVPADCEPGRADAKGLLVVDADSLEFYESMGTLGEAAERSASRIRAEFAFTGEGMTWEREMELATTDGGETMVRTEFGDDAMPGPQTYARCT